MENQTTQNVTIHLFRTSQFLNKLRKLKVYVDGEYVDDIKDGEQIELKVPEGERMVQVKIDWTESEPYFVKAHPSESIHLECGSPLKGEKAFDVFELLKSLSGKKSYLYVSKQ